MEWIQFQCYHQFFRNFSIFDDHTEGKFTIDARMTHQNFMRVAHTLCVLLMFWLRGQSVIKKSKCIAVHNVTEMSMITERKK